MPRRQGIGLPSGEAGATRAWLVHRQPLRMVVPVAAISLLVVYLAMRIVHLLVAF